MKAISYILAIIIIAVALFFAFKPLTEQRKGIMFGVLAIGIALIIINQAQEKQ